MTTRRIVAAVPPRLRNAVPPGTLPVGLGLAVLGVAAYVHLAVAGHTLPTAGMSSLAVLWSVVFAVGFGLFFPVEQEITRRIAAERRSGEERAASSAAAPRNTAADGSVGAVARRGALLAGAILAVLLTLLAVLSPWLSARLFGGDASLTWALGGALASLAVAHTTRGVLAGTGRFGTYGTQLGLDGGLRIVLAAGLGLAGVRSPFWFAALLTIAPLASVALTLPRVAAARAGDVRLPAGQAGFARGLALLTVATLASQVMVNAAVVDVRLLAPDDTALAAAMLAAIVLVRVPLFVFASLQASLLSGLAAAVGAGRLDDYRRLLIRTLGVVSALGAAGGALFVAAGPALATALFDAPALLGAADFAWLATGTLAYLWTQVLGQGVLALGRHRDQTVAWLAGSAVLVGVTLSAGSAATRVEVAYALGSFTVATLLAWSLRDVGGGRR